ncbi:MAG: carotenoid biosynthesis protein [Bacteroidota bacterium]
MKYLYLKLSERLNLGLSFLVIIHFFGVIGLISPLREYFIIFTPITLIISAVVLFSNQLLLRRNFIIFCLFCFIGGFVAEFLGVNYGIIFGDYSYGPTLGYRVNGVPLIIGLNWLLLIYSVGVITSYYPIPTWLKIVSGGMMTTVLDVFIEPVAIEYNFWKWTNDVIPFSNYLGWFVVSMIMLAVFHLLKIRSESKIPIYFYIIQLAFFLTLWLV